MPTFDYRGILENAFSLLPRLRVDRGSFTHGNDHQHQLRLGSLLISLRRTAGRQQHAKSRGVFAAAAHLPSPPRLFLLHHSQTTRDSAAFRAAARLHFPRRRKPAFPRSSRRTGRFSGRHPREIRGDGVERGGHRGGRVGNRSGAAESGERAVHPRLPTSRNHTRQSVGIPEIGAIS